MPDATMKPRSRRNTRLIVIVICLAAIIVALIPQASSKSLVRTQLAELASQKNWSLLTIHGTEIQEIQFADRSLKAIGKLPSPVATYSSISRDGTWIAFDVCPVALVLNAGESFFRCPDRPHLAVVALDGTGYREYSNLTYPIGMCWSPDDSKLVLTTPASAGLEILDVKTGNTKVIDSTNAFASDQCWSPDGKHVVYFENQDKGIRVVKIYDAEEDRSHQVASGAHPSWSPDGTQIAFASCPPPDMTCAYQTIHPDGSVQTVLFKIEPGESPLLWSPDSQYVAYRSWRRFWEHSLWGKLGELIPVEHLGTDDRLRIRRLDDNSEDWLLNIGDSNALSSFQWIPRIPDKN